MDSRRKSITFILIIVLSVAGIIGLTWLNYRLTSQNLDKSHFVSHWLWTRLFLTEGLNPYSPAAQDAIRNFIRDQGGSLSEDFQLIDPFYVFLVYAPFALISRAALAQAIWMTALEISLFVIILIGLNLSRWRISKWNLVVLIIFSMTWYYSVRPLLNGDTAILSALLIVAAFSVIREEQDILGGILLALASIKPSLVLLPAIFMVIWAISWRRWSVLGSLAGSLLILVAVTSFLIPDWVVQNLKQIIVFFENPPINTPGALFAFWLPGVGKQLGWLLTILFATLLLVEWRASLRKDSRWFLWAGCLTIAVANLVGIPSSIDNFVAMLPGLILILATWDERWGRVGRWMIVLSYLGLWFGIWALVYSTQQRGLNVEQNVLIYLILPIFMIISLYWVRLWAVRPSRLPLEELTQHLK